MGKVTTPHGRIYGGEQAEQRRARRRSQLLQAGLELLGTQGWHATTVTAVSRRARLTPRYFYESFANRDELLLAIFDGVIDEVVAEALGAEPADHQEMLRAMASAFVRVITDDPRKGRAAFSEALGSETLMKRRLQAMARVTDLLIHRARAGRRLGREQTRRLHAASLIAVGGLIETMIVWLDNGLNSTADDLINDYTLLAAATLRAAAE